MMAPCRCCGQHGVASTSTAADRRAHWVDDDLLACFNRAHDDAERRGMAEVEVGHLLLALMDYPDLVATVARSGIDPGTLSTVIEATLPPRLSTTSRRAPRAAADLRILLDITEQTAAICGQAHITARAFLATLLALPSALASCRTLSRWFWAARAHPGDAVSGRFNFVPAPMPTAALPQLDWLQSRLDRQDQLLVALHTQLQSTAVTMAAYTAVQTPATAGTDSIAAAVATGKTDLLSDDVVEDDEDLDDEEAEQTGIKRYYLSMDDEIVRAPSIGPATAARLQPHGVTHVKHLLACDPERLSARIGARHLTTSRIAGWKNQARLVCSIPWLRGTHAQLLVGAGYASIERILSADRLVVCAAILQFATTRDGQSILRNGQPPDMERIMRWIENSQQAEPQRAEPMRSQGSRVAG